MRKPSDLFQDERVVAQDCEGAIHTGGYVCSDGGRKFPGKENCTNVDSEEEDESTSRRKGTKHSKKPRDKAVMTVEVSGTPSTDKKAKAEAPGKEGAACTV